MSDVAIKNRSSERYLVLLAGLLAGYALMGKGFAYLGLPPLFVGEIVLLAGVVTLLRIHCVVAALATLPSLLLAGTMAWVLLRTLPFLNEYGVDALRDSVVIMYGGFTFIVIGLLLDDARRIDTLLDRYRSFLPYFLPAIAVIFALSRLFWDDIPKLPGRNIPLLWPGPGEVAVHLAGAAVFGLAGFYYASARSIVCMAVTLAMVAAASRAAILAFALPVTIAILVLGRGRQLAVAGLTGLLLFAAAFMVETAVTDYRDPQTSSERPLSVRQIAENFAGIIGQSGEQGEDTKQWRIQWWNSIVDRTVYGPEFWTGRGFGLNLASADGLEHAENPDSPPLRSPHNVHLTILARAGVPGLFMWALLLASWAVLIVSSMLRARRRGHEKWAGLFLFIGCYVLAIIVNATFDVALEGPMQGIWFWCLFGFGIGAAMIYRCQPSVALPMTMHRAKQTTTRARPCRG